MIDFLWMNNFASVLEMNEIYITKSEDTRTSEFPTKFQIIGPN